MSAGRYGHIRTGFELGEAFGGDVRTWYALGRDIGPLISEYVARRFELGMV